MSGGGGGGGRGTEDGKEGMIHKWFLHVCGHFKAHQKVLRISEECVTPTSYLKCKVSNGVGACV